MRRGGPPGWLAVYARVWTLFGLAFYAMFRFKPLPITGSKKEIVILGAGFGGLYTALQMNQTIATDPWVEVTLINRENFHLFTPMLHEVAASDVEVTHIVNPIRKMLKRVHFVEGPRIWCSSRPSAPPACPNPRSPRNGRSTSPRDLLMVTLQSHDLRDSRHWPGVL
ncbi:MAG: hypothetical protein ACYCW6_02945 [Candidatus Xenobia bacterium]